MKKVFRQIQNTILIVKRNLGRACLTSLGIIICMTVYVIGTTLIDSYISERKTLYANMNDNEIISEEFHYGLYSWLDNRYDNDDNINCNRYSIYSGKITNVIGEASYVDATLIGVNDGYINMPFRSIDTSNSLEHTSLLSGRAISYSDIIAKNYVVNIHASYAKNLFGSCDVLGKVLRINGKNFVIVGVLKDTPDVIRTIRKNSYENEMLTITAYIPNSLYDNTYYNCYYIIQSNQLDLNNEAKKLQDLTNRTFSCKSSIISRIDNEMTEISITMNVLLGVLTVFSSIVILIVMLFNVKERFYEIGIRRAIGASKDEICFSVLFEGLLYSIFGIVIGLPLGVLIGFTIQLIKSLSSGLFVYSLALSSVLLPTAIILASTTLFSLIPALVAANMNISICLKVE